MSPSRALALQARSLELYNLRASADDVLLAFPVGGPGRFRLLGTVHMRLDDRTTVMAGR